MTKFGKNCCKDATFHHFFHDLNDFYHIILFIQLLFFGIICFWLQNYKNIFLLPLSFSFTHSLFLKKVRSPAGAATPVYAENAVSEVLRILRTLLNTHISARCANCANDSGGTIPHKRVFSFKQLIRSYSSSSVTIRHYLLLSGFIRH